MKTTTKLLLSAIALLSSMGCTPVAAQGKKKERYYPKVDTLTIYKSGLRRIVIGKKVTYLATKYHAHFGEVNVLNLCRGVKSSVTIGNITTNY